MDKKRLASRLVLAGGVVEILIALLHFVWPFQLIETGEFSLLSTDYKNLMFLSSISIGLCLAVFGVLSIRFSKKLLIGEHSAWVYGISQGILWEVRTVFELIFPVKIPLLCISKPTVFVLPLTFLLGLLFLIPLLVFRKKIL
jgi:hypothetical protein